MEVAKGNWVGFQTVFYNEKTGQYGTNINHVIDFNNLEFDMPGLSAYLDYGYCVFGYTPVKNVKYLLPYQSLMLIDGKLQAVDGEDKTLPLLHLSCHEDDVLALLEQDINHWADKFTNDILIPTSGGFDSRLLNLLVHDKSRIHAYTYGTSNNQQESREVVYAKELSQRLKIRWDRINLGEFNAYQEPWFNQFGCSVGALGTYHMEFYKNISLREHQKLNLLSGIIGDAWAGAVSVKPVTSPDEYSVLGHTHQMHADSTEATGIDYSGIVEEIFDKQKDNLRDPKYRILTAMRTKMMLLQSLITIPDAFGFVSYSPFIDEHISMSMLGIADDRRKNREWQRDFFRKNNVLFEEEKHVYTYQNSLNYYSLLHHKLELLNVEVLREVISEDYLLAINNKLQRIGATERFFQMLMHKPKVKEVMKLLGFKNDLIKAYFAYCTLKPIEQLLLKRNAYVQSS